MCVACGTTGPPDGPGSPLMKVGNWAKKGRVELEQNEIEIHARLGLAESNDIYALIGWMKPFDLWLVDLKIHSVLPQWEFSSPIRTYCTGEEHQGEWSSITGDYSRGVDRGKHSLSLFWLAALSTQWYSCVDGAGKLCSRSRMRTPPATTKVIRSGGFSTQVIELRNRIITEVP